MAQNINLLPVGLVRRATFSVTGVIAMTVLLAGGIACVLWLGATQLRNTDNELKRVNAQAERLERELAAGPAATRPRQEQLDREETEIAALEAVAAHLDAGALGRTLGFADRLEALARSTAPGVWLSGVRLDNRSNDLTLDGRALDADQVPVYLATLKGDPLLAGTVFADLAMRPAEEAGKRLPPGTVRFNISTALGADPGRRGALAAPVAGAAASTLDVLGAAR